MNRRHIVLLAAALVVMQVVWWGVAFPVSAQTAPPPQISKVEILTPSVARFEKVEIAFDVATSATHVNLPFAAEPPAGVKPGIGVSVDALLTQDNWATTIVQPAFFYQPFTHQSENRDHFVPDGAPHWLVRFAPRTPGDWQVRLRVRDSGGETIYPQDGALDFKVFDPGQDRYQGLRANPYTRHGFLRVGENDPRYFEFEDGSPFLGLGYNSGSDTVESVKERYRAWQQNGIEFARVWMSGSGINGSAWTPWTFPKQPYNYGLPAVIVSHADPPDDADLAYVLTERFPCRFVDFWQGGVPVQPNATYEVSVRAIIKNATPKPGTTEPGVTLVQDGWINNSCAELKGAPLVMPSMDTSGWFTLTTSITTGKNQKFLNYLYVVFKDIEKGTAYFDDVRVVAKDDPAQVNLLRDPNADSHMNYDNMNAGQWDLLIEEAEQHGVYLKVITDEKNEWIRNIINRDGSFGEFDKTNNNFYAADNTKVRWLDEAWWRYLIARICSAAQPLVGWMMVGGRVSVGVAAFIAPPVRGATYARTGTYLTQS